MDENDYEVIEIASNEINNNDEPSDSQDSDETDDTDDYDSDYEQNKQLINYSRNICETISKMIERLKHEEEQECENVNNICKL